MQCSPHVMSQLSRPSPGVEMAASLFSKRLLEQLVLRAHLGIYLLQPPVLIFKCLHLADHRRIHPTILRPPLVKRSCAHAMFPAKLGYRNTAFRLANNGKDLRFAKSARLHQNLLNQYEEKILLLNPFIYWGDYP
ncbi:hypothetical protein MEG_01125 [Bartonella tamiae Th307]|uniref:Uncharacterized protein n=1 Tax=Bartonella tamiae Th239 TaxID=1094558 RepID=J0ZP55_9HYPH|nr:hypothetical protein ME5_00759 [Bartonella tamiae Th239]EJF93701.1 hypothetical protein MEG_01125 [Bartonella tamiae Th307]